MPNKVEETTKGEMLYVFDTHFRVMDVVVAYFISLSTSKQKNNKIFNGICSLFFEGYTPREDFA